MDWRLARGKVIITSTCLPGLITVYLTAQVNTQVNTQVNGVRVGERSPVSTQP